MVINTMLFEHVWNCELEENVTENRVRKKKKFRITGTRIRE